MNAIYPWQINDWDRLLELRKRLPHGLLFKGNRGTGKFELATAYAKFLLCSQPVKDQMACGTCNSCHWFDQSSHPDFRLIQPAILTQEADETEDGKSASGKKPSKLISVDQIRSLNDFLGMTAHQGAKRVVILHPAETMNPNAANALLKSLEEPPADLLFILVTDKPQQLLPTIRSRCLSFPVPPPKPVEAIRWLEEQKISNPAESLAAAGFAPLLAAQMVEPLENEARSRLLREIRQPKTMDIFGLADALQKSEQISVVQWLQQWCYDLTAMKLAGKLRYHVREDETIRRLVESVPILNLVRLQNHLNSAKREARHTLNPKLFFESLFMMYRQLMRN